MGNQKSYIEEVQTIQLSKEREQRTNNDLQNITQKIKDRATRTPLSHASEFMCFGMINV